MTDPLAEWIIVPNWERFQHYKDRAPTWIKLYTDLRNRDEWRHLTLAQRGLLGFLWLEYAASRGQLRTSDLPSLALQKVPRKSIDALVHAGFITLSASKPLALTRARALAIEEEAETEEALLQAVVEPSTVPFPEQPPPLDSNQPAPPSRNGTPAHEFENDLIPLDPHAMLRQIGDAP